MLWFLTHHATPVDGSTEDIKAVYQYKPSKPVVEAKTPSPKALAGFPKADLYASAFGRACAKAYRANHGAEPQRVYAAVNGRIRRSQFGYADVADLLAGAHVYSRTAEFLAAEQNTADVRTLVNA